MSGHNKWSKVKNIKAKADAKKGKAFSKLSKEISIAARDGGGDPGMNPRLRTLIDSARAVSMPKDNIDRAIKKGTGELGGEAIEEFTYEGFAPGGVALIVEVSTDSKNRAAAAIRMLFNRNHGHLGNTGSVLHQFKRRGEIRIALDSIPEDAMLDQALEAGADDVSADDEEHVILTAPEQLGATAAAFTEAGLKVKSQNLIYIPDATIAVADASTAAQVLRLYEALDDYEDTLNVYSNFDIPDALLEEVLGK